MWHDVRFMNVVANFLLVLVLVAAGSACFWWFAQKPVFELRAIRIEEAESRALKHVNAVTVRSVALPRIKGNFFTVDLDNVREAFRAVPWVRDASVRRQWPNGLLVLIEEHRPLGTWNDDGRLVSVKGDIFTANLAEAEEEVELLKFRGPEGTEKEVLMRYVELRSGLEKIRLMPVLLELSDRYAWHMVLNNGMTVLFGRDQAGDAMKAQTGRLLAAYPKLVNQFRSPVRVIDLRYPNGMAVKADSLLSDAGDQ